MHFVHLKKKCCIIKKQLNKRLQHLFEGHCRLYNKRKEFKYYIDIPLNVQNSLLIN